MDRSRLTSRKQQLTNAVLPSGTEEAPLLRQGRAVVLLLLHDNDCAECTRYLDQVSGAAEEIDSWGADVAVAVRGAERSVAAPFRSYGDPEATLESTTGATYPGVVIADQWGDMTLARSAGPQHDFPPITELVSEVRYLGTRCPECEGEWL